MQLPYHDATEVDVYRSTDGTPVQMHPVEVYRIYVAIKLHFSSDSYDYFRKGGRIKMKEDAFEKRKDKAFFVRLAKKYSSDELELFFATNFMHSPNIWVGDFLDKQSIKIYTEARGRLATLAYVFSGDLATLLDLAEADGTTLARMMVSETGEYPHVIVAAIHGMISIETLIILMVTYRMRPAWDRSISDKLRWPDLSRRLRKYRQFFRIDAAEYKTIVETKVRERETL